MGIIIDLNHYLFLGKLHELSLCSCVCVCVSRCVHLDLREAFKPTLLVQKPQESIHLQ